MCRRQKEVSQDNFQPKYESYILLNTRLDSAYQASAFFCFFFQAHFSCFGSVGSVHCLWNSQTSFFNEIFIKNESYGTIYIFKNYFATMFSIFNFQQNKWYPNTPVRLECTFLVRSNILLKNDGSCTLFTGPASTFFSKKNFKTGPTLLFTYLKIILL